MQPAIDLYPVSLRRFPYPYKAMLAICSDLDGTPDADSYFNLMRFLNTSQKTVVGTGAGLEIGNSIYFNIPPGQFSYWNTDDGGREKICSLIKSGHIDCLHSFGNNVSLRAEAASVLEELDRSGCFLQVWVDHGGAPTNFGTDIMKGHGDEIGHEAYHADLTAAYGIRYIWIGRVTSVIGQDRPFSLRGIANWKYPGQSIDTLLREYLKHLLGRFSNNKKYAMHFNNQPMQQHILRDGVPMYQFMRCNPHWGGVSSQDRGDGIHEVLTRHFLDRLIERQGVCILYTHLAKIANRKKGQFIGKEAIAAFQLLSEYYHKGKILVTTTQRLLDYVRIRDALSISVKKAKMNAEVYLRSSLPESEINNQKRTVEFPSGITMYVSDPESKVFFNTKPIQPLIKNGVDETGRQSLSVPWEPLVFPHI
jgi:hypothetical protein